MSKIDGKRLGNVGEAETLAAFVRLGVPVFTPFGDSETADLLAEFGGRVQRIQCKSSGKLSKTKTSVVFQTTHKTRNGSAEVCKQYKEGEVDYFALYNRVNGDIYLFPWTSENKRNLSVVFAQPSQRQRTMHYAEDHLLERVVAEANRRAEEGD